MILILNFFLRNLEINVLFFNSLTLAGFRCEVSLHITTEYNFNFKNNLLGLGPPDFPRRFPNKSQDL
jgi:hypothetical protein